MLHELKSVDEILTLKQTISIGLFFLPLCNFPVLNKIKVIYVISYLGRSFHMYADSIRLNSYNYDK